MIPIKELRIGNIVSGVYDEENELSETCKVVCLDQTKEITEYQIWVDGTKDQYENFEPIPLTEEWLRKCGFEKDDMDFYKLMLIDKPSAYISINIDYDSTEVCQSGLGFSVECKRVHQLQNLYFALTGKQLTFKTNEN